MTIRVLVADDQTLVRSGLAMILATQSDIEIVGEAADGARAVELARQLRPDVVLMDIRMPGIDGLSATRTIVGDPAMTGTRIVVLTTYDLDEYLFAALRAGAAGFILKGASPEDLIRAVRETAAGDALLAPSATRRLINEFVSASPAAAERNGAHGRVAMLTPRELEVLALMAKGFSNTEIADQLIVGENTVKTHVSHVLDKLAARDRVQAVIAAYDAGVISPVPGSRMRDP